MTLGQGHATPSGHGQQLCEILSRSNIGVRSYMSMHGFCFCVYRDLDLRDTTFHQGHDIPLGYGQQWCEILSISSFAIRIYRPYAEFGYVHSDFDLGGMTLRQGHETPLGHGQQLWNTSIQIQHDSKESLPYTDFIFVWAVTLEIRHLTKVIAHHWVT